jgi:hypothetical protein
MKAKFSKLLIMLSIVLGACGSDVQQSNNELLTLAHWKAEQKPLLNGEVSKFSENHNFYKDGTYALMANEIKIEGKWNWTNENEIYLRINSINIKGAKENLNKPYGYYIRIMEVSDNKLKTLERFEGDAWDSGFAKEKIYIRS